MWQLCLLFFLPGIALVIWFRLAKRLVLNGFPILGFSAGLSLVISANFAAYYSLLSFYRESQKHYGTCYTCELTGIPFLVWFIFACLGLLLYIGFSGRALFHAFRESRSRESVTHYLVPIFVIIMGLLGWQGFRYQQKFQRNQLAEAIHQSTSLNTAGSFAEVGRIPQPFVSWLNPFPSYVNEIRFSSDNQWALLTYDDKLVLWHMNDLAVQEVFEFDGDYLRGAFSPDCSFLVLSSYKSLITYNLDTKQSTRSVPSVGFVAPLPPDTIIISYGSSATVEALPISTDTFVNAATYSEDRTLLLVSTADGYLRFFQQK